MREIKFRIWDKNSKTMMNWEAIKDHYYQLIVGCMVSPSEDYPIMQYTGLKDKNGKETYEGDIVKMWSEIMPEWAEQVHEVKWYDEGKWSLGFRDARMLWEIIGNIYENPDLLPQPKPVV